jgi:hypothetical protein
MIFIFFMEGGGGGGGVLGVLIGESEPEWEMQRTGWGGSTGCIMHRVHTSSSCYCNCFVLVLLQYRSTNALPASFSSLSALDPIHIFLKRDG